MPRLTASAPKPAKRKRAADEMKKFAKGKLKSSSGDKVTNPAQAKAIAMSESGQAKKRAKAGTGKAHSSKRPRNRGRA